MCLSHLYQLDRRKTIACSAASEKVRERERARMKGRTWISSSRPSRNRNELTRRSRLLPSQIESASPLARSPSSFVSFHLNKEGSEGTFHAIRERVDVVVTAEGHDALHSISLFSQRVALRFIGLEAEEEAR